MVDPWGQSSEQEEPSTPEMEMAGRRLDVNRTELSAFKERSMESQRVAKSRLLTSKLQYEGGIDDDDSI